VQLLCALAGLGLGLLLPRISTDATVAGTRVTEALVAVGFGVLGLVTVIFSLLFLVVQWAFSSLSPRLTLFRDDPIVWRTFAFAVGVFVFSVTTALVVGDQEKVSVVVPAAEVVAVLAAIALIRTLQVKAFASIQLAPTLAAIPGQGRGVLEDLYPRPYTSGPQPTAPLPPRRRAVLWPHRQAILQQIDLGRLLRPPSRYWTPSRACSSPWHHVTWTWPTWPMTPGLSGWYWPSRPGTSTCAPPWTTSSSPRPDPPWCCCAGGVRRLRCCGGCRRRTARTARRCPRR